jgi:Protein of unknown function (DUF1569)
MTSAATDRRRDLYFTTLDDLLSDLERLAAGPVKTVGNWTFAQILEHLAQTFRCSIEGFHWKAPWLARVLIAPWMKNTLLTKPLKPGFQLPKRAAETMPSESVTTAAALTNLQTQIERYRHQSSRAAHPFLGNLAEQEWTSLHLRHSELHLSFVVPDSSSSNGNAGLKGPAAPHLSKGKERSNH